MGTRSLLTAAASTALLVGAFAYPALSQQPAPPAAPAAQPAAPAAQAGAPAPAAGAQPAAQPAAPQKPAAGAQPASPQQAPAGQPAAPPAAPAPAAGGEQAAAGGAPSDPAATGEKDEKGLYHNAAGEPTFKIAEDGTVDWGVYSGYRRYHSECHVCHGPEAMGSTFAPNLSESLKTMPYSKFQETVSSGRQRGTSVMPAFGANVNVMCYLDDIYVYLRARAVGGLKPGRPEKKEEKPEALDKMEKECLGLS